MPRQKLIATAPMTYRTRRLQAGDPFEVKDRYEATIWTRVRKTARLDYDVPVAPLPGHAAPPAPEPEPDLDALRAEAEAAGVRVDKRWGEARLRQEIASAPRQKPPEPQPQPAMVGPQAVPAMTLGDSVRGASSDNVPSAVNVGSTAHPVYRRPEDC